MTATRLTCLLGALGLVACGDEASVVGTRTTNRCVEDSQCRDGVCDLTHNRCVAVARTEVFFRVLPPDVRGGSNLLPTLTPSRSIRTGEAVDLTLRARRTVYGTVTAPRDGAPMSDPTTLPATVLFVPSDMPGLVSPVEAIAQAAPLLTPIPGDRSPHTWLAALPEGSFDVMVRPALALRGTVPPRFERRFDVRADSAYQRFDIVYSGTYSRWSGVVTDRAGLAVTNLAVRAIDPARNDAEVSTVSVTAATTSESPGGFSIAMAPGAPQEWSLRVTSNVNAHAGFVLEVPRQVCAKLDPTGRDVRLQLPTNAGLPFLNPGPGDPRCTDCVQVSASVEARVASGAARPLRGATVTLRTTLSTADTPLGSSSRAWFEDRVQTDADGSFTSWLIPGEYEVFIEPQSQDLANAVRHAFRVRSDARTQAGQVFNVEPRVALEGRVLTASSEPLRGAHVQAVPFGDAYLNHPCLQDADLRALSPAANPGDATTSADGSYRLALDPGLYRLLVEPPTGSGFAATLSRAICVATRVRAFDIVMESPVEVHGTVRDSAGATRAGAGVEAILRVREGTAPGVTLRVARTSSGANGAYSLLLPLATTANP